MQIPEAIEYTKPVPWPEVIRALKLGSVACISVYVLVHCLSSLSTVVNVQTTFDVVSGIFLR